MSPPEPGTGEIATDAVAVDVIVVGGGGAGLIAAAEARKLGRSVMLLEKAAKVGGTTALAVGSIMATRTAMQRRAGIEDSPEDHADDLGAVSSALQIDDDPALRRVLAENAAEAVALLESIGVDFIGPMPQPPHRKPRLHQVVPGARAYVHHLEKHCRGLGVDIRTSVRVENLQTEGDRVVGVEARRADGSVLRVRARNGVILASGDASASKALIAQYIASGLDDVAPYNPLSTGDGQAMATRLGGHLIPRRELGAGGLVQMRFAPPDGGSIFQRIPHNGFVSKSIKLAMRILPDALLRPLVMRFLTTALTPDRGVYEGGAILVNANGHRFADELAGLSLHDVGDYARDGDGAGEDAAPNLLLSKQPGAIGYVVFDDKFAKKFSRWPYFFSTAPGIAYAYVADYRDTRKDLFRTGATVEELASRIGADPKTLSADIAATNASREDPERRLDTPPYHALGPLHAWIFIAPVGLSVDPSLRVLKEDGTPIPGLYAAGSTGSGRLANTGHGHGLGWAFASGLVAARSAANSA